VRVLCSAIVNRSSAHTPVAFTTAEVVIEIVCRPVRRGGHRAHAPRGVVENVDAAQVRGDVAPKSRAAVLARASATVRRRAGVEVEESRDEPIDVEVGKSAAPRHE